jgi:hypothetical protein
LAASLAGVTAVAGPVWTWTDGSGQVHYGDTPPSERSARRVPIIEPQAPGGAPSARRPVTGPASADPAPRPAASQSVMSARTPAAPAARPLRAGEGSAPTTCEERWRRFHESAACFSRFRVVGGGVKADAFRECAEVPMPERCE